MLPKNDMKTRVMVNGLPGKLAAEVAEAVVNSNDFNLLPYSLSGNSAPEYHELMDQKIQLVKLEDREAFILQHKELNFLTVDCTHPTAVNINGSFYCKYDLPFVMGTTGGDRDALRREVEASNIAAVVAPNMAKQIVAFQAMLKYAADNFPDVFQGYSLEVIESHQKMKADVSGTAKAVVSYFNDLGIPFKVDQIKMIRDPEKQQQYGIPKDAISGHAWHTYTLKSEDGSVLFQFTHNINGRYIYRDGTLSALKYLRDKIESGEKGKVYSMIDVLKQ